MQPNQNKNEVEVIAKHDYNKVRQIMCSLDLPVYIEDNPINFIKAKDDGEYYVDKIMLWNDVSWRANEITSYMNSQKNQDGRSTYSQSDIKLVQKSIDRLDQMGMKVEETVTKTGEKLPN